MAIDAAYQDQKVIILRLNLALALVEGLFVFGSFLREPSESQSAIFLGFSSLRLVLLFVVLVLWLAIFLLFVSSFRKSWWDRGMGILIWNAIDQTTTFWALLLWTGLMYVPLFLSEGQLGSLSSYRERLSPVLVWSVVLSIQMITSFVYIRSIGLKLFQNYRDVLLPAFVALILLGLFIAFVAVTGLGLTPDPLFWLEAGVPILLTQVLLAWVAGLMFYSLLIRLKIPQSIRLDLLVSFGLWGLACLLWLSQPSRPSYNSLAPSAPNFQSYPFGDSIIYDIAAHEYLIGKPIPSEFGVKPLYALFLACLHLFSGENYTLLISLQIIVLAVIPVLVYLLTVSLSNRPAGLVAAALVIVRERNGIALSNVIEVSHTKLLLSDVFAMGLVVLSLWLFFRWFEKPKGHCVTLLAIGGVLGLLSLTRGHPIILVPLVFCIILLVLFIPMRLRLQSALLFTIGVAIPLAPWLWRNYEISGEFAFQDPVSSYTSHITRSYSLTLGIPARLYGETDIEYYDRLRGQAFKFIVQHPGEVAKFVSAHYVHNTILSYVYLPHSFRIESLRAYVKTEPFWRDWKGGLQSQEWVLLCLNVCLIALGIGSSWRKKHLFALIPLVIGIGYNISVSIGRISGWRYIQPSDWITLIYYSIGLIQFSCIVGFVVNRSTPDVSIKDEIQTAENSSASWTRAVGVAIIFFLIGTALTYGNQLFSYRYPIKPTGQLMGEYLRATESLGQPFIENELDGFIQSDNAKIVYGQAIYPYFLKSNSGPINHYLPGYKPRPYSRLVFYLVGPASSSVVLPMPSADFEFPDGADVIVLGCKADNGVVDAVAVLITGNQPVLYTRGALPDLSCPLPEAE